MYKLRVFEIRVSNTPKVIEVENCDRNANWCQNDWILYQIVVSGPFYSHGLYLILAWINNNMPRKIWDEITYLFPNVNGATGEIWQ